jgi:hypothetical protein
MYNDGETIGFFWVQHLEREVGLRRCACILQEESLPPFMHATWLRLSQFIYLAHKLTNHCHCVDPPPHLSQNPKPLLSQNPKLLFPQNPQNPKPPLSLKL